MRPVFSICIPAYNSAGIIGETVRSVLAQTFTDYEIVIVDDASSDDTEKVIRSFAEPRIRFYRNERNLGLPGNFRRLRELAVGEFIYLLGNDDILAPFALERTYAAFRSDERVGVVTRPYYWFQDERTAIAVRHVPPLDASETRFIDVDAPDDVLRAVIHTVGQISALAFRSSMLKTEFGENVFTTHIIPFLETFRESRLAFLHEYVVAVRIASSQTRYLSSIYKPSPTTTWIEAARRVFPEPRYRRQRAVVCDMMASHYTGLVQIRAFAPYSAYLQEVGNLVRYRPKNLVSPAFWTYAIGLAIVPRRALRILVDRLKQKLSGVRNVEIPTFSLQ